MESSRIKPQGRGARSLSLWVLGLLCCASTGCVLHDWGLIPPPVPPRPAQTIELRDEGLEVLKPAEEGSITAQLAGAREYFRREEYMKARILFHHVAGLKDAGEAEVQEAMFYEAEAYRLDGEYPKAADTYKLLMTKYPRNRFRSAATRHMFEIAQYWLDDTRAAMREEKEIKDGKRWMRTPRFFHWDKTKPFADEEGRAIQLLEQVHFADIGGEEGLGPQALFLAGGVKYFNEEYEEADLFFTQIHERHKNHKLAEKALEYAIQAKQMSTGGAAYDGRTVAEARLLVDLARRSFPDLARRKKDFLDRQMATINVQQAAKEFQKAEFYERRGHPGSAYFYFELVRRRYPGTQFADQAKLRLEDLQVKHPDLVRLTEVGRRARQAAKEKEKTELPTNMENKIAPPTGRTPPPPPRPTIAPPPRPLPAGLDG